MARLSTAAFLSTLSLGMAGIAAAQGGPSGATGQVLRSHVTNEQSIKAVGTVESIDRQLRALVLHWNDGSYSTFRAPREMRNFNQIKLGDVVEVEFQEAEVISLVRGGTVPSGTGDEVTRSRPGERPHGQYVQVRQHVATVQSLDIPTRLVALRNEETGVVRTIRAPDRINLEGVNPGDKVVVTSGEAVLVDVRPAMPTGSPPQQGTR